MKKYIDCDGVIFDTESGLFEEYNKQKEKNLFIKKSQYLSELDWHLWIRQSMILADAINILKNYNPLSADILTKVHSLKEAKEKILYFRELGIENNIIIVPSDINKSQIVSAQGNILVDDSISNIDDWYEHGGIPFYFGNKETKYEKIKSLERVMKIN